MVLIGRKLFKWGSTERVICVGSQEACIETYLKRSDVRTEHDCVYIVHQQVLYNSKKLWSTDGATVLKGDIRQRVRR